MSLNVLVLEDYPQYSSVFTRNGWNCDHLSNAKRVEEYDLICLIGGSDVDPKYYGEEPDPRTHSTPDQDAVVFLYIQEAIEKEVPIVGICKGAQQLCVFEGGKLHQHVVGHEGGHDVILVGDGSTFYTRGNHHQMMDLNGCESYELLAYAQRTGDVLLEPEVVYFDEINALGFQYHPEWMDANSKGVRYFFDQIQEKLLCAN